MITDFIDLLFGCWHTHYSFPITSKTRHSSSLAAQLTGTYIVCLDCGKEFPYDWKQMKVVQKRAKPEAAREHARPLANKQAA